MYRPVGAWAQFVEQHFNAGAFHHGLIAWLIIVLPLAAAAWIAYALAFSAHPVFALAVNVAVLYVTLGFRQASHFFTDIHTALKEDRLDEARRLLGEWRGGDYSTLSASEVVRLAIEGALAGSHRYVFGAMFWFVLLPGPAGAVVFRLAGFLRHRWSEAAGEEYRVFGEFARRVFDAMDWVPARITAVTFAVVGDFEDAIACWRTQAAKWPDPTLGVILAAGAGAIGVRLGMPIVRSGEVETRPGIGTEDPADVGHLDSTIGLVWRALVLWIAMLAVLGIAQSLG